MSIPQNTEHCPNCGHEPFNTSYCPNCGQRKLSEKDHRITTLLNEFAEDILNLDNSFIRTVRTFFIKPNVYITEYLKGARKKYLSPIKLFILSNAFYFVFPAVDTFKTTLNTQLNRLPYSEYTNGFIRSYIDNSGMTISAFEGEYNELTQILSKAMLILIPLMFAGATWILNIRKSNRKPLLQHINYSLALSSFFVFFLCSVLPGAYKITADIIDSQLMLGLITEFTLSVTLLFLLNIFAIFLYRDFLDGNVGIKLFKILLLNLFFIPLLQSYRFFLLMITLGWMTLFG